MEQEYSSRAQPVSGVAVSTPPLSLPAPGPDLIRVWTLLGLFANRYDQLIAYPDLLIGSDIPFVFPAPGLRLALHMELERRAAHSIAGKSHAEWLLPTLAMQHDVEVQIRDPRKQSARGGSL